MKLHQQFDLNPNLLKIESVSTIPKKINKIPELVEELIKNLIDRGYIVISSSARYMGIPQSITVVKDFTGPFVTLFSTKVKKDFNSASKALGINKLFK